jgi:hypothetical protein
MRNSYKLVKNLFFTLLTFGPKSILRKETGFSYQRNLQPQDNLCGSALGYP